MSTHERPAALDTFRDGLIDISLECIFHKDSVLVITETVDVKP
jgi:hypothetical protein